MGKVFRTSHGNPCGRIKRANLRRSSLIAAYIHNYFKVNPFTLDDVRALGWDYTDEDLVKLYHVTGGMPGNLVHIDPALSVDEKYCASILQTTRHIMYGTTTIAYALHS